MRPGTAAGLKVSTSRSMYSWRLPLSTSQSRKRLIGMLAEGEEPVERDAVVAGEPRLPFALERGLAAGQERPGRIADERQPAPGIALPVAGGVQPSQRLDGPVERAVAPLGVGVQPAVVGERGHDLDAARGEPLGQVGAAREQEDREVAPVHHVLAARHGLVDEVAEVGVQLGRPAGDVDRVRGRAVEGREAEVDRLPIHVLRHPVGPGVDVAVAAGHVAEAAHVDLEDLERRRPEPGPAAGPERRLEVAAR